MGAGVSLRELIIDGEDGSRIGTGEMDDPIDNRVWFSLVHHVDRYSERSAFCSCGRGRKIEGGLTRSATAGRDRRRQRNEQCANPKNVE